MNKKSQRWIKIGTVKPEWYAFFFNWGCPHALLMVWKGKVPIWQPCEFLKWEYLIRAVARRLARAGLEAIAVASAVPKLLGRIDLMVLVMRRPEGRL